MPYGFPSAVSPAPSDSLYPSGAAAPSEWITDGPPPQRGSIGRTEEINSAAASVGTTLAGFTLLILVYTCMGAWSAAFAVKRNKNPNFALALLALLLALPSGWALDGIMNDKFELMFTLLMIPPIALSLIKILAVFLSFRRIRARRPALLTAQLEATNSFEDMTSPTLRTFLVGMVQFVLMLLYVTGIRTSAKPDLEDGEDCDYDDPTATCTKRGDYIYYYSVGVFVQTGYVIGTDQWESNVQSVEFWANAFHAVYSDGTWEPEPSIGNKHKMVMYCRFLFGTFVNTAGLVSIMLLLPLQVAVGDPEVVPLDFVLNVVAAFYIVELDDMSVPQAFSVSFRARPPERNDPASFQQSKITSYLQPSNSPTTIPSQRRKHSNVIDNVIEEEEEGSPDMLLESDQHQAPHANTNNNRQRRRQQQPQRERQHNRGKNEKVNGKQNETKNEERGDTVHQDLNEAVMHA
jgi:hypothetical protein